MPSLQNGFLTSDFQMYVCISHLSMHSSFLFHLILLYFYFIFILVLQLLTYCFYCQICQDVLVFYLRYWHICSGICVVALQILLNWFRGNILVLQVLPDDPKPRRFVTALRSAG